MFIIFKDDNELPDTIANDAKSDEYVVGKDVIYTTGEVANMLGIGRDKLRYHVKDFEEFLTIEKTGSQKGAHWRFHSEDIELIQTIIRLKDSGESVESIKRMIGDPDMSFLLRGNNDGINKLSNLLIKNNELMFSKMVDLFQKMQLSLDVQQQKYIEDTSSLSSKNEELNNQVKSLEKEISELKMLIEKRIPEKKKFFGFKKN